MDYNLGVNSIEYFTPPYQIEKMPWHFAVKTTWRLYNQNFRKVCQTEVADHQAIVVLEFSNTID